MSIWIVPIISILLTVLSFTYLVTRNRKLDKNASDSSVNIKINNIKDILELAGEKRDTRLNSLEQQFYRLEGRVNMFIEMAKERGKLAALDFHSPHTPELDNLIDKFYNNELRDEKEIIELIIYMKTKKDDNNLSTTERKKALEAYYALKLTYPL